MYKFITSEAAFLYFKAHAGSISGAIILGNVTGYPGVFQGNPYPYPSIPVPASTGTGFPWVTRGYCIYKYHLLLLHSTYIVITDDEGQTLIAVSEVKQRHDEEGRALLVVLKWE